MGKQTLMHGQPHHPESSTSKVAFSTFWLSPSHGHTGQAGGLPSSLLTGETKQEGLLREGMWFPCQDPPGPTTAQWLTIYCFKRQQCPPFGVAS